MSGFRGAAALIATGVLIAGCSGSSGSDTDAYPTTTEACDAFYAALENAPGEPELNSAGFSKWSSEMRALAEQVSAVADKTEGTDAIVYRTIRDVSDSMFAAADAAGTAAEDATDEALIETNEAVTSISANLAEVNTACGL